MICKFPDCPLTATGHVWCFRHGGDAPPGVGQSGPVRERVPTFPPTDTTPLGRVQRALGQPRESDQHKIAMLFLGATALCLDKNLNYGSSFRSSPRLAPEVSAQDAVLVRIDDKEERLTTLRGGEKDRVGESLFETMRDSACYRLLWCLLEQERLGAEGD